MKSPILENLNANKIITYSLIIVFAYSLHGALLKIIAEGTLGSILRHLFPSIPVLFLIYIAGRYDFRDFSFPGIVSTISLKTDPALILKRYSLIALFAIIIGIIFIKTRVISFGLFIGPVVFFLIAGMIFSSYCMVTGKRLSGIIIFLLSIPALYLFYQQRFQIGYAVFYDSMRIRDVFIPLSSIYIIMIALFFFIGQLQNKHAQVSNDDNRVLKIAVLFVLSAVCSVIFSKDPSHSFVFYLIDLVIPFLYFFILMKSIKTMEDIKKFIFYFTIAVSFFSYCSLYYLYIRASFAGITTDLYGIQAEEFFAGFSALHLTIILPLLIGLYFLIKGWQKILIVILTIASVIFIYFSNSRIAIISLLSAFSVFFYYYRTSFGRKLLVFVVFVLILVLGVVYFLEYYLENIAFHRIVAAMKDLSEGESMAVISSRRTLIWQSSLEMIRDFPIFGVGPDMWNRYIHEYSLTNYFTQDILGKKFRYYASNPHNILLKIWLDYGVMGFVFYSVLAFLTIKRALQNIKTGSSKEVRVTSMVSFIAFIIWVIWSVIGGTTFYIGENNVQSVIFWSVIALTFKLHTINTTLKGLEVR